MQDKYTELSNDIGGTYKGYKKNAEKVKNGILSAKAKQKAIMLRYHSTAIHTTKM